MRTFSKLLVASLVVSVPALFAACNGDSRDDDGMGGESTGGTDGDTGGGSNSGGNGSDGDTGGGSSSGGTTGGGAGEGGMGGGSGGGSGGSVEPARFTVEDCQAVDGPNDVVTGYTTVGAFTEDADWLAGWTNWSIDSTPEDDGGADDGAIETCAAGDTCSYPAGIYTLEGNVYVEDGATMEFEPGTIIRGSSSPQGTLIVSRGGTIDAVGTAEEPIIFTSDAPNGSKVPGGWGGLILLGKAKNFKGPNYLIEGLEAGDENQHGGLEDDDSSGTLQYVRIEFGGVELAMGSEINGLSLGSVGSGTSISYVQVNTTLDDGFEWFGGTADADHLVVNNAGDDMFDADDGFRGTVSFGFGRHVTPITPDPNGFEIDGDSDAGSIPAGYEVNTEGEFENFTVCADSENDGNDNLTYGATLRRHFAGTIDSAVLVGFDYGLDLRDEVAVELTNAHAWDNFGGIANAAEADNDGGVDESDWFADQDGNVDFDQ